MSLIERASHVVLMVKNPPASAGNVKDMRVRSLGWEGPLEEEMATHSSILAWEIPRTEEPGRLHTAYGVAKNQTQLNN